MGRAGSADRNRCRASAPAPHSAPALHFAQRGVPDQAAAPLAGFALQPVNPQRSVPACRAAGGAARAALVRLQQPLGLVHHPRQPGDFPDLPRPDAPRPGSTARCGRCCRFRPGSAGPAAPVRWRVPAARTAGAAPPPGPSPGPADPDPDARRRLPPGPRATPPAAPAKIRRRWRVGAQDAAGGVRGPAPAWSAPRDTPARCPPSSGASG